MILVFKLLFAFQLWSEIKVTILDKVNQRPIPFAQISICEKTFESDENGKLTINLTEGICEFTAFAYGYETVKGSISLKNKGSLVFQLEPNLVELENFTIEAKKIDIKNGKELVELAIQNFSNTHINSFDELLIKDSITFSLGNEEFFRESKNYSYSSKKTKLHELDTEKSIIDPETYQKLQDLIKGSFSGPINQKVKEYTLDRTDLMLNLACDYYNTIECYFSTFYSTQRAILFNPFFYRPSLSQKLDHYGFFNSDFLKSHQFRLIGIDSSGGKPSFIVRITSNRNSKPISLGGQEISDWYKPVGTIWIDQEDLALVKMVYRYEFTSTPKILNASVDKAEFESGPVYFENILEFRKIGDKYFPLKQFTTEKDRNLRVFYNDTFFESVYVQHFVTFSKQ